MNDEDTTKAQQTNLAELETIDANYWSPSLVVSLTLTALIAAFSLSIYEIAKHTLSPEITIWQSRIGTIVFGTVVATVIAAFVLRKCQHLTYRITQENTERKQF